MSENETQVTSSSAPQIGRNEPCPCGSGKKYKRCCGMDAAPKLSTPSSSFAQSMGNSAGGNPLGGMGAMAGGAGGMPGFDPSQFDPNMMMQFSQLLGRLPKGQLQKLQNIMQKAMAGKDVTREAKDFEGSLPVELQTLLAGFQMPGMPGVDPMAASDALDAGAIDISSALSQIATPDALGQPLGMTEEEARAIVESAAKQGKISEDQAQDLLKEPKGMSKLWKKISGK